tara:strand:- start:3859 stop:4176 length:318 start_codon:yes stop_codon:yes gene_type:complete
MSWSNILKSGSAKKLNISDLREITLSNARPLKGQTLDRDDYFRFMKIVSKEYSLRNHGGAEMISRVRTTITQILKRRDLLEIKKVYLYPNHTRDSRIERQQYTFI